jgi:myo-inositol-1(or 4)-monophosphatase
MDLIILNELKRFSLYLSGESTRIIGSNFRKPISIASKADNSPDYRKGETEEIIKLADRVYLYRRLGDCYGYYLLVTGFADIMLDTLVFHWDILPVIPIIRGAGDVITHGEGFDPLNGTRIVSSGRPFHQDMLCNLNRP